MPKVRIGGLSIWVYTRDERGHRPHVHVFAGNGEVVVVLTEPVRMRESRGATASDIRRALKAVAAHRSVLLNLWHHHNGG